MIAPKLVGLLCFQLIILTTARSTNEAPPQDTAATAARKAFSLDDITSNAYSSLPFNGTWISETEIFYRIDELLLIFDTTIQKSEVIANSSIFDDEDNVKYYLSPDKNFVLIRNETQKVYRHSSLSKFSIFDRTTGSLKCILENGQLISVAVWAPQGSELIYVFKNDIYYYQVKQGETRRLTFDGRHQTLYNGIPDWVYEEEVYSSDKALWVSPAGEYLAFGTFNDSQVPEAVVMRFGAPGDAPHQYPNEERFRYPKAGATNPQVTLNFINLKAKHSSIVVLKTPVDKVGSEAILYAVTWFDEKTLVATWSNRVQNQSVMLSYSVEGKEAQLLLEQKVPGGWLLYAPDAPLYHKGYVLIPKDQAVANKTLGSFGHVTRYSLRNGRLEDELDLTPGETWVYSISGVSEEKGVVYYTACPPGKPTQKHLYEVELEPKNSKPEPKCISCKLKTPEGNECQYVSSVVFSANFSRYVLTCTGPDPSVIKIFDSKDAELYSWSDNYALRQMLAKRVLPRHMDLTFPLNGFDVQVRLQLPTDFEPSKKYPLYVNVYAGPGSQAITENFAVGYDEYVSTAKNVIEAKIDGRGSNSRGTAMLYSVYRNLGSAEMIDQIEATKLLQEKFPWIDANRTAVGGWSYGGYSTATILSKDKSNVFKCGHSGAPVTNWMYYDSIYTERYMGLPTASDNLKNYEESSVMKRVKNFKGKRLLLIHGTGDDNVHFQNSMALTKALAENDIMFEQFVYPDEAHQFVHLAQHLSRVTDNFVSKCFGLKSESD